MGLYPYRIRGSGAYGNGVTRQEGPIVKSSLVACTSEQDKSVVETPRECKPNDGIVSIQNSRVRCIWKWCHKTGRTDSKK